MPVRSARPATLRPPAALAAAKGGLAETCRRRSIAARAGTSLARGITIDHALPRPSTVARVDLRTSAPPRLAKNCCQSNPQLRIGRRRRLSQRRRQADLGPQGQPPPDPSYFRDTAKLKRMRQWANPC